MGASPVLEAPGRAYQPVHIAPFAVFHATTYGDLHRLTEQSVSDNEHYVTPSFLVPTPQARHPPYVLRRLEDAGRKCGGRAIPVLHCPDVLLTGAVESSLEGNLVRSPRRRTSADHLG